MEPIKEVRAGDLSRAGLATARISCPLWKVNWHFANLHCDTGLATNVTKEEGSKERAVEPKYLENRETF
jgi:hypothetical protein